MATPHEQAVYVLRRALLDDGCVDLRWVLTDPRLPDEFLATFLDGADAATRVAVAGAAHDPRLLRALAGDDTVEVRLAVAANDATPGDIVAVLLSDSDPQVGEQAAAHEGAPVPPGALAGGDLTVREAYARNPAANRDTISTLARHGGIEERRRVAQNPATPLTSLEHLACDTNEMVRLAVAQNPAASDPIVEYLLNDEHVDVVLAVVPRVTNALCLHAMIAHPSLAVRCAVASHTTDEDALGVLAADRSAPVRREVALNDAAPAEVLSALVDDSSPDVRSAFASRSVVAVEVTRAMVDAPDWRLRAVAAQHQSLSDDDVRRLAADPAAAVRARIAARPLLPGDCLPVLLEQRSLVVEGALIANPACLAEAAGAVESARAAAASPHAASVAAPDRRGTRDSEFAGALSDSTLRELLRGLSDANDEAAPADWGDLSGVAEACLVALSNSGAAAESHR